MVRNELVVGVGRIESPGRSRDELQPSVAAQREERLLLDHVAPKSVLMPGDHDIDLAAHDGLDEPTVRGAFTPGIGAAIVVLEVVGDLPALRGNERLAVGPLAFDARPLPRPVQRNACVYGSPSCRPQSR